MANFKKCFIRILIVLLFIVTIISCNNNSSTNSKNSSQELPDFSSANKSEKTSSDYFEIINNGCGFDDGRFKMNFDFVNKSNILFTSVDFHITIDYVSKSLEKYSSYVQCTHIKPNNDCYIKHVAPNSTTKMSFDIGTGDEFGYTPKEITLVIKYSGFSVDVETGEKIATMDLLPYWIEKQKKLGLR